MTITAQSADGAVHQFPDGTKPEVIDRVMKAYAQEQKAKQAPQPSAGDYAMDMVKSGGVGLGEGIIGTLGLPADAGNALGRGATWLIDKAIGTPPEERAKRMEVTQRAFEQDPLTLPTGQQIANRVQQVTGPFYEPKTVAGEYARTAGQFAPGIAMGGGSLPARIASTAAAAGASETAGQMTKGTEYEPYARIGAALLGGVALSLGRRIVTPLPIPPERAAAVNALANEGVGLTAGQATGRKALQYAESEIGGARTAEMLDRQGEQFTAAALKRAGINADRATPEVMDRAFTRIGKQFDDLAARNPLTPDPQFARDITNTVSDYANIVPASQRAPVVGKLANDIIAQAKSGMSGAQYQTFTSRLAKLSRETSDAQLKQVFSGMRVALDDAMERGLVARKSPDLGAWREVRNQYRNMLVLEKAASGAGENTALGIISPSQLRNATVQQSRRGYVRGAGDYSELARAGEATMKPLPNSGTAPRFAARTVPALVGALLGHGITGDTMGMALGAATGNYALGRALMSRPVQAYLKNQIAASTTRGLALRRAIVNALMAEQKNTIDARLQ